jgi:hypothetical protein
LSTGIPALKQIGMTNLLGTSTPALKQICHPEPERTRISCYAALINGRVCGFQRGKPHEDRNATNLDRKSGVAEWRDLLFTAHVSDKP